MNISSQRGCRVSLGTSQSINDASATVITFDTVKYNPNGLWDSGAGSKITVDKAGLYLFQTAIEWAAGATGLRTVSFRKNGEATQLLATVSQAAPASGAGLQNLAALVRLVSGDYIEVLVTQNNGGALNATATTAKEVPSFSCALICPEYDPSAAAEAV